MNDRLRLSAEIGAPYGVLKGIFSGTTSAGLIAGGVAGCWATAAVAQRSAPAKVALSVRINIDCLPDISLAVLFLQARASYRREYGKSTANKTPL